MNHITCIGKIDAMKLQSEWSTCGYVQFRKPEHAARLLRERDLECAGAIVRLWKSTSQPSTHILNLNDDCLQEIFLRLDVEDLLSVTKVNERFKANVQIVFPIKYKSFEHKMSTRSRTGNILKYFGHFIEKLVIERNASHLELVASHCGSTLKKLYFTGVTLNAAILQKFRPVFARLHILRVNRCELSNAFIQILRSCSELKALAIIESTGSWQLSGYNLPKLETVVLLKGNFELHCMESFLECNPQIKNIMIRHVETTGNIISKIAQHLPLVESIVVRCRQDIIEQPSFGPVAFKSLKRLYIDCTPSRSASVITALAATRVPLEHLELYDWNDSVVDAICNLKTIKTLYWFRARNLPLSQLIRICRQLSELVDLLVCRIYLDADRHKLVATDLLTIVRNAPKLQRINFWHNSIDISSEAYAILVEALQNRAVKTRLEIIIDQKSFEQIFYNQTHEETLIISGDISKYWTYRNYWPDTVF